MDDRYGKALSDISLTARTQCVERRTALQVFQTESPFRVKMRKTQHEQMFSAVPPIADILGELRFGFVEMQQAHLHSITAHNANDRFAPTD